MANIYQQAAKRRKVATLVRENPESFPAIVATAQRYTEIYSLWASTL